MTHAYIVRLGHLSSPESLVAYNTNALRKAFWTTSSRYAFDDAWELTAPVQSTDQSNLSKVVRRRVFPTVVQSDAA